MNCYYCNAAMEDGDLFCSNCGKPADNIQKDVLDQIQVAETKRTSLYFNLSKSKKIIISLLLATAIIVKIASFTLALSTEVSYHIKSLIYFLWPTLALILLSKIILLKKNTPSRPLLRTIIIYGAYIFCLYGLIINFITNILINGFQNFMYIWIDTFTSGYLFLFLLAIGLSFPTLIFSLYFYQIIKHKTIIIIFIIITILIYLLAILGMTVSGTSVWQSYFEISEVISQPLFYCVLFVLTLSIKPDNRQESESNTNKTTDEINTLNKEPPISVALRVVRKKHQNIKRRYLKNKSRTRMILLICSVAIILTTILVSVNIQNKNIEREYVKNVKDFLSLTYIAGTNLDDITKTIQNYWYDHIFNDMHGYSIDTAISEALRDQSEKIVATRSHDYAIQQLYEKAKMPPNNNEEYREIADAVKSLYNSYTDLRDFAQMPTGSFNTYSATRLSKTDNFFSKYNVLNNLL